MMTNWKNEKSNMFNNNKLVSRGSFNNTTSPSNSEETKAKSEQMKVEMENDYKKHEFIYHDKKSGLSRTKAECATKISNIFDDKLKENANQINNLKQNIQRIKMEHQREEN